MQAAEQLGIVTEVVGGKVDEEDDWDYDIIRNWAVHGYGLWRHTIHEVA